MDLPTISRFLGAYGCIRFARYWVKCTVQRFLARSIEIGFIYSIPHRILYRQRNGSIRQQCKLSRNLICNVWHHNSMITVIKVEDLTFCPYWKHNNLLKECVKLPGAPLTYFNDGGGGGGSSDFFGSEILAKSDLLGSMKDAGNFFWVANKNRGIFLGLRKKE